MSFINLFPTLDLFVIFLFVVFVLLHLIFVKKSKLLINFISIYTSFALVIILPLFVPQVAAWLATYYWVRAAAFVGVYVLLGFILHFSNVLEFSGKVSPTEFITSLVYRIGIIGLLFTTILYFLPAGFKVQFGVAVQTLFVNFIALVIWFFVPIFFAFAFKFKTRRGWLE